MKTKKQVITINDSKDIYSNCLDIIQILIKIKNEIIASKKINI